MRLIGWIMPLVLMGACKQVNGNANGGLYPEAAITSKPLGIVSVPIYSSIGVKSPKKIRCQLIAEARKLFPRCRGILKIRYNKYAAYAEVIR